MTLVKAFFHAYPWPTLVILVALLVSGVMEGLSLSTLLPLLSTAIESQRTTSSGATTAGEKDLGPGQIVIDGLAEVGIAPTLGALLLIIVTGIFLKNVFLMLAKRQVGYTVAHVATDLRLSLIRALLVTRWEYYVKQSSGVLLNAIATEAQRAATAYYLGSNVVAFGIQVLVYFCVAFFVSWKVTVVAIVASMGMLLLLNQLIRIAKRAGTRQTALLKSLLSAMTDSLQAVKPLKAMARESLFSALLEASARKLNKALRKQVFSREALRAAQEPMLTMLVAIGLYMALEQWGMPFENVMVLMLLLAQMLSRLGKVQRQYQEMAVFESAYWSLTETIRQAQAAQEDVSGTAVPALSSAVTLDNVTFAYGRTPVLNGVSLVIRAGAFTSIVGASGAGKTTIVDLVIGLMHPQGGQVLIDGVSLREVDLTAWRRTIGYVPQETFLLHDSVFNNVTLGDPHLTVGDAELALTRAGAWDFVQRLPEGIESSVGEHGRGLSGGQRQRIAIARALAHQPALLILDEATSAVDADTEAEICDTLRNLRGSMTILAISHQTGLIRIADDVYRLDSGTATRVEAR